MEHREELIIQIEKRVGRKNTEKKIRKKKTEQKKIKKTKDKLMKTFKKKRDAWKVRCPICFNNINDKPVSSTKCGHVFCTGCLQQALCVKAVCPTCRRSLRGNNGYHDLFLNHNIQRAESVNSDDQLLDENLEMFD